MTVKSADFAGGKETSTTLSTADGPLAQQREAAATDDPARAGRCMTATAKVSRFDPERAHRLYPEWGGLVGWYSDSKRSPRTYPWLLSQGHMHQPTGPRKGPPSLKSPGAVSLAARQQQVATGQGASMMVNA